MAQGGIVTVLFAGAAGDTEAPTALLRDVVADSRAHEITAVDDDLMVLFFSAVDAVGCAVAMQQASARAGVALRIGMHVGEPSRQGDTYVGPPVAQARELFDAATSGRILASDLIHALVGSRGDFTFTRASDNAWEVAWEDRAAPRLPLPTTLEANERLPFVGREELLAAIDEQWQHAQQGDRALVMLAGEPGIGKTRLAMQFGRAAHAQGAHVLFGHADEETLLPYQPFVEAFHHVVRHTPVGQLEALVGAAGAELGRLLPALHDHLPGLAEPLRAEPESERYRLFEAATSFVGAVAAKGPLVLILDDLHWADKPTLLLLHHLLRTWSGGGLLIIGTYRDTDLDRRHPLSDTLADLRRLLRYERLAVGGLGPEEVHAFLHRLSGQDPPPQLVKSLCDQTEGNPFYVSEVLRNFVESGAVSRVDDSWVVHVDMENLGIPEGVKEVVGYRLTRLSADANAALAVAAIAGRDFDPEVVALVTEFDDERLLNALEEAVAARLISEVSGLPARFHFEHALVRETLYDELTTARRVRLHRRIAQTLEKLHAGDDDPPLAQLAFHYVEAAQAGDVSKSVDYACRAGAQALSQLAYEEAAHLFEMALQALDLSDADERATRAAVLLERGRATDAAGDVDSAQADFKEVARLARELGDGTLFAHAALGSAGVFTTGTIDPAIVDVLEEAVRLLPEEDSGERALVLCRLGIELYWGGDHDRMQALAHEGMEMARRVNDPRSLGAVLNVGALLYDDIGDAEQRLALSREAARAADAARDGATAHLARNLASWAQLELGDRAGWEQTVREGVAKAREMRVPRMRWYVPQWQAAGALIAGDLVEAERLTMEMLQLGQAANDPMTPQIFGAQMFSIRREQGRLDEFEMLVRGMVDEFPAVPAWRGALALLLAELGNADDAGAFLDIVCADNLAAVPRDNAWAACLTLIADASFLIDSPQHAAPIYPLLAPFEDRFVAVGQAECFGSVARILGQAAATCGRQDEAVAHFDRGIAADHAVGGVRMAVRGQWGLARTLLARGGPGDTARAAVTIADASETADRVGLVSLGKRLRSLGGGG